MSVPTPDADPILERVAMYKGAARRIVEADGPMDGPNGKLYAVASLAEILKSETDLVVREWCREAIWREVREPLYDWRAPLIEEPRLPYAERIRLFVIAGYRDCPTCGERFKPGAWRDLAGPGPSDDPEKPSPSLLEPRFGTDPAPDHPDRPREAS